MPVSPGIQIAANSAPSAFQSIHPGRVSEEFNEIDSLSGKFHFVKDVQEITSVKACDFLARHTGLSKSRIKEAMSKGAVWIRQKGTRRVRLRKATFILKQGDILEFFSDPEILSIDPPQASCVSDHQHYSLWIKPANLLTQGTDYGDYGCLLRQVEKHFFLKREVYPVHRLDREVEGLILVAHSKSAAGKLSGLFRENKITKRYRAQVLGLPEKDEGLIAEPLDGKNAVTRYQVVSRNSAQHFSELLIEIETGRLHQIRRHLAGIGHPVMGDPRYGKGNKNKSPLKLTACELQWVCPFTGKKFFYRLPLTGHPS